MVERFLRGLSLVMATVLRGYVPFLERSVIVKFDRHRGLLLTYLRPQRGRVTYLAVLLLGSIALQLASPQVVRFFIDTTQRGGSQSALITAAILFLAIALAQRVVALGAVYVGENVGWTATNDLRADLVRHCIRLDMPFHKSHTPGELIERIDGDVSKLASFLSTFILNVLGNGLLVVGILVFVGLANWWAGACLALYALLTLLALRSFQAGAVRRFALSRQASAEQYGFIEERLSGTEDIRANGAETYILHRLYRLMRSRLETERASRLASNITFFSTNFLYVMGYAIGLGLGAYLYTQHQISIGTAFLIVYYIQMLFGPLDNIRSEVQDLQEASASIGRVDALLRLRSELRESAVTEIPAGPLSVEFDSVSFGYEGNDAVVRDISFHLPEGRVLGLLGRTGSGKTTLIRLLVRLYDPQAGSVRIGGTNLRDVTLADLRGRASMVTQDVQLFKATVRDNLTFFDERVADEDILRVLHELGLSAWYRQLPRGLDTTLEVGGGGLSAGEAQLLALARVFLKDPGLVILDEASSRLDPATEHILEGALARLFTGRTGMIIAHRLKTVQRADDILILDEGRIVEYGPRQCLAADPASRFHHLLKVGLEEALA